MGRSSLRATKTGREMMCPSEIHIGMKRRKAAPSVGERMQAAYEKVTAKKG